MRPPKISIRDLVDGSSPPGSCGMVLSYWKDTDGGRWWMIHQLHVMFDYIETLSHEGWTVLLHFGRSIFGGELTIIWIGQLGCFRSPSSLEDALGVVREPLFSTSITRLVKHSFLQIRVCLQNGTTHHFFNVCIYLPVRVVPNKNMGMFTNWPINSWSSILTLLKKRFEENRKPACQITKTVTIPNFCASWIPLTSLGQSRKPNPNWSLTTNQ